MCTLQQQLNQPLRTVKRELLGNDWARNGSHTARNMNKSCEWECRRLKSPSITLLLMQSSYTKYLTVQWHVVFLILIPDKTQSQSRQYTNHQSVPLVIYRNVILIKFCLIGTDDFSLYHLLSAAAMFGVLLLLLMCLAQIHSNRSSLWFLKGLMSCWLQPGWWKLNTLKHGLL